MLDTSNLVSIGLPIYNEAQYISRAIDSWLAQDYSNFELVIVDNASTDGTAEICRAYSGKDERIRLIENPQNIGTYRNHKLVFEMSRGKYFTWAGGHDYVHPSFISKTIQVLNANANIVMCTTRSEFRDENNACWRVTKGGLDLRGLPPYKRFASMLNHAVSGGTANLFYGLYRREMISSALEFKKSIGSDVIFLTQVALLGEVVQLEDVLYYRFMSRDRSGRLKRHLNAIFGEHSFELGFQLPNINMLLTYIQVIEESDLAHKDKQFMMQAVLNEATRIQAILINEFSEFLQNAESELIKLEKFPLMRKHRATQILNHLQSAKFFGLEDNRSVALSDLCYSAIHPSSTKPFFQKNTHNAFVVQMKKILMNRKEN